MRIRSIKPEFWRDEVTGEMAPDLALFFIGLWCFADDDGRFEWSPRLIRADLDPFDTKFGGTECIAGLLDALEQAGRVRRYEVNGRAFGIIPSFHKHQHPKKPSTRCPSPFPDQYGTSTEPVPPGSGGGRGSGEGSGGGGGGEEATSGADAPSPPPDVVAALPCVGRGSRTYLVTEAHVRDLTDAYPGVDVVAELKRARLWLEANPTKQKTHAGMPRFLQSWVARTQDGQRHSSSTPPTHNPRVGAVTPAAPAEFQEGERELK